ncbi:hypothetical protein A9200_05215 [Maribacter hydrothermalis]|uniref:DUF1853 domain-containing protein n=2 Tax=Maribacter hydrothermalis TaxID=1836467 RepID=A0A1B7Z8P1_9FLAO|nr:hypothetical protein BTR34_17060 [Maribacter hydrothermalis]OBR39063.1 hypothetical protein A9200_05215 [Maribacter hydrothermalis]
MEFGVAQFEFPKLDLNEISPIAIPQKLRLGHQMEYVCKQLLDASDEYQVLLHNRPIREGKQTIGEIDFILKEATTKQLIHVELTYKFYLIDTAIENPIHQLVGPNRSDAFYKKLEKIKNNQFSLLHTNIGRSALLAEEIDTTNIKQEVCYKAQLFQPYKTASLDISPINSHCNVGYWLRMAEFNSPEFMNHKFYIPTKSEWVFNPFEEVTWVSHDTIVTTIEERLNNKSAPMIWMKKCDSEFEKFFVVWW